METAEHEMLRSRGLSVHSRDEDRTIGWPRVEVACRYEAPARFGDELLIEVRTERRGQRSMIYAFRILRDDTLLAEGRMSCVCCELSAERPPRPIPIPAAIRDRLPG